MRTLFGLVLVVSLCVAAQSQTSTIAPAPARLRIDRDLEYAQVGGRSLKLDLYTREGIAEPAPIVVWISRSGEKSPSPTAGLVAAGYAIASIEYRRESPLSDGKAAIRWLRANAQKHNLDGTHIGVWGFSAGGNLAQCWASRAR